MGRTGAGSESEHGGLGRIATTITLGVISGAIVTIAAIVAGTWGLLVSVAGVIAMNLAIAARYWPRRTRERTVLLFFEKSNRSPWANIRVTVSVPSDDGLDPQEFITSHKGSVRLLISTSATSISGVLHTGKNRPFTVDLAENQEIYPVTL